MPIYDIINFYKEYYNELDFCELLRNYEAHYRMLPEEKVLFFVLISIPSKIEFTKDEYTMCKEVRKFYEYINTSEKLLSDYFPNKNEEPKTL